MDRTTRGWFIRAALLLPAIAVTLRLFGFRATQKALQYFLRSPHKVILRNGTEHRDGGAADVSRTARMARAAARYGFVRPTCLEESLALWWLLAHQGIASSLRIGTRKTAGHFEAHAWVEWGSAALNEGDDPVRRYAAFDVAQPVLFQE